jgi:N-acyl-phosphatidylethanolamine-hydrolysing phospholipase D
LATLHAFPEDAIPIQRNVCARHALGMHFATFAGSIDEAIEPLARLERAAGGTLDWCKEGGIGVVHVGETAVLPLEQPELEEDQ